MSAIDVAALYQPSAIKNWGLPAPERLDPGRGAFRALRLGWAELAKKDGDGQPTPIWLLCCDVLTIDRDFILDRPAYVFARRIEVKKGVSLILDRVESRDTDLTVFAQEVVDHKSHAAASLPIISLARANGADEPVETTEQFKPDPATSYATGLQWPAAEAKPKSAAPSEIDAAHLVLGSPLRLLLMTTFQVATLLSGEKRDLSIAQSGWIATLASASPEARDLAGQAAAMAGTLVAAAAAATQGAVLVPRLDAEIYASASQAMMTVLRDRDKRWEDLQALRHNDANWLNGARAMLAEQANQTDLHEKLENQAQAACEQAVQARSIAAAQLQIERVKVRDCELDFELGIKRWEEGAIRGEIVNIIKGAFDILLAIPAVVAGAPHLAAMPAIQTVAGIVNSIFKVAAPAARGAASGGNGTPALAASAGNPTLSASDVWAFDDFEDLLDNDGTGPVRPPLTAPPTDPPPPLPSLNPPNPPVGGTAPPRPSTPAPPLPPKSVKPPPRPKTPAPPLPPRSRGNITPAKSQEELAALQAKMLAGLQSAGKGAADIVGAAMKIAAIAAQARAMEKTSQSILNNITATADQAFSSNILEGLDSVTGGEQEWELLAVTIEDTFDRFQDGLLKSIGGGADYRLAFRRLAIRGRSLCEARLAVAKANMQLAELKLRRLAAGNSLKIAQTRLKDLQDQTVAIETLSQFVFNTTLDSKRAVYLAMEAYQRAFLYFTLADEPPPLPRITDTVDAFGKAVADISGKLLVRQALNPPPQTLVDRAFEISDPDLLAGLKKDGCITWTLDAPVPEFRGFGRIRIDRVRILAEGAKTTGEVQVHIATSGNYSDKDLRGRVRKFVSEPMSKTFVYQAGWKGGNDGINMDGDIARRYQDDFFNPTPFTTWTLAITGRDGNKIDLSALTGLKFFVHGEVTKAGNHLL